MTIAMRQVPGLPVDAFAAAGHIARIEIFETLAAAEPHWRAMERGNMLATPYQQFDLLVQWQHHIGAHAGVEPLIVAAFDAAGAPLALFPFGLRRFRALRIVSFLGDEHINFNMALWRREFAESVTPVELNAMLTQLAARADLLALTKQPVTWNGGRNPMAMLPQQPSPSFSHSGRLGPDFDVVLQSRTNSATRKKLRKKAELLASFGPVRFARTKTAEQTRHVLDAFFSHKSARLLAQGIPNGFDEPQVCDFLRAGVTEPSGGGQQTIELYVLWAGDTIAATMGGIVGSGRFCGMFNSINPDHFAAASPGDQIVIHLVRHCCERGLQTFDLGVGEARYKGLVCNDIDPLFDSFIGLTSAGRMAAFAARWSVAGKRQIKQTPVLWWLVDAMRRLRSRLVRA
jgi:CelD/BcsL family acetyltransferase involved in cellulose biosynthesis